MNTSSAPDVDRVLAKLGRGAFGYRSFHNVPGPPAAPEPAERPDASPASAAGSAAALFPLLGAALPEAANVVVPTSTLVASDVAPAADPPPANPPPADAPPSLADPRPTPAPAFPPADPASSANPFPPREAGPSVARPDGLAALFRSLAGRSGDLSPPAAGIGTRTGTGFPFRRR